MTDLLFTRTEDPWLPGNEPEETPDPRPIGPNANSQALTPLSHLSDNALHRSTEHAARDEQRVCLILLEHLVEVERRRLYAKRIFPTLHEYVRSLGYTDGQAQERIMAARLLKKVPEAKEAFEAKTLNLTTMAMVQRHSAREGLPIAAVTNLVKECESLPTRAVQKILVAESTTEVPAPDKIQPVSKKLTRLTLEVDDEFLALLERTKELKGNPGASLAELFTAAMNDYVKKREVKTPKMPKKDSPSPDSLKTDRSSADIPSEEKSSDIRNPSDNSSPSRTVSLAPTTHARTRYIPAGIKNALRVRSDDRCERVDKATGKRCTGRIGLEADHYPIPFARGGPTTLENLRWVCRAHNTEFAIQAYGLEKMQRYLKS